MEDKEFFAKISSFSKDELIALWESLQNKKEVVDYRSWMDYLESMNDETSFNKLVASNSRRIFFDFLDKHKDMDMDEVSKKYFNEIRKKDQILLYVQR